jgi:GNAT superfamily N-acetyltransferase
MSNKVEKLRVDDICVISVYMRELGYHTFEVDVLERLTYLVSSHLHEVLIARADEGQICGWVVVEERVSLECGFRAEITSLVGEQSSRRNGVGTLLVENAESWARAQGMTKLVIDSNINDNISPVFYKKLGFSLTQPFHHYEKSIVTQVGDSLIKRHTSRLFK